MAAHTRLETRLRQLKRSTSYDQYLDMLEVARAQSAVIGADSVCISSDQTVTTAAYGMDKTVGGITLCGTYADVAAWADVDMLAHARALTLAGGTPAALDAGYSYIIMIVSIILNEVPAEALIFGAAALSGAEVAPTLTQCQTALRLAAPTNYLPSPIGVVQGTVTMKRVDVVTLTYTGTPDVGAPADNVTISYAGTEEVDYDVTSGTLNTEVAALAALLVTALAAATVTVSVATNVITITADDGTTLSAVASVVTLGGAGDLAVAKANADTIAGTHSAATTDAIKQMRLKGILHT